MLTVSRHACHEFYQPGDPSMYRNKRREGHGSVGASELSWEYYLSEGSTAWGFTSYVLVQNPNDKSAKVRISYLTPIGTNNVVFEDTLAPLSRKTYRMADKIPSGKASILVESEEAGRPVMAERSMYWNNRGAGTDTIGGNGD